ncbi:MAG: amino acid adenylation domain-containing protein, partial [bacterium]|nr:amino acid adenylation domain-containing protein [bacterium]
GRPLQVVAPVLIVSQPVIDLRELSPAGREDEALRLTGEEARRPFDLVHGPLLRATLLRLDEMEHMLLVTMHHIVSDAWSMGVFIREIGSLYQACAAGGFDPHCGLGELPIQYADFALWQRRQLTREALESQLGYWRRQLAGIPAELELPTDRPRPPLPTYLGATHVFFLPAALVEALEDLGQRHRGTLFMPLLAAFMTLLHRYSGQHDLPVGSPIANRNRSEIEGLIGFFVNTLVLRGDLSGGPGHRAPRFAELLDRVREVALGAYAHQDLPFEKLVEELQPERDPSRPPIIQVMFAFQNTPLQVLELAELTLSHVETDSRTAKFDLTLTMRQEPERMVGALEYATDLFDGATIARMTGHLRVLLEAIAAQPQQRISSLPLMAPAERRQLLAEWNDTASSPGARSRRAGRTIHALFEAQAAATPDAVAVICAGERVSYRELNRRANRLARYLRVRGIAPEIPVGICMERSPQMLVGILAILKAGGACLPLDPNYPRERLGFMLRDARAGVLLTQERYLATLGEQRAEVVCPDRDQPAVAEVDAANPAPTATAENLAYLIYTSGSTGRAKGVAIEHRSTVAMLEWARGLFTADELAGVLAATSICFDISVFELFLPLIRGGTVIVAANALELTGLAAAGAVTLVNTVPSALRELLRLADLPSSVRTVNLAGEALNRELVEGAYRQGNVERVFNLYGPSEDTTYSTFALQQRRGAGAPPIGRPVGDTRSYVLDRYQQPVPIGVPGELYLAGDGLARCYLDRPELTAERFVPDPWSAGEGRRLYRTGDLVRTLTDGNLAFLGRLDHQVKLRGFRIELGEIEAVLTGHPGVRECVVVAGPQVDAAGGDLRLIAYVVSQGEPAAAGELRDHLRAKLPEYMVPAVFVELEALPLGATGKVDRRALPRPEPGAGALGTGAASGVAPRDPVEEVVAGIWSQLLGIDAVAIHDDFFDIGGHSLLATQVLSRLRLELGAELPVRALFEHRTVAELAGYVTASLRREPLAPAPPIRPVDRRGPLPSSFAQQRLWFIDRFEPGSALYNLPAAMRLKGGLDRQALARALDEIVRRHEVLRTVFATVDGEPVQVIRPAGRLPVPLWDLTRLADPERRSEARRLVLREARQPFDLARGPVLRAGLLRLSAPENEEHVLVVTVHHVAFDGWSAGVFLRELTALYQARVPACSTPGPAELPVQYADFAVWQRQWLVGEVLESQLAYWR